MTRRWLLRAGGALLIGLGLWQAGETSYIEAKAWLAQGLLEDAWAKTLDGEDQVKPWPWADTWPVARLRVPALDIDRIVLAGASGRSLAFGPAHLDGTGQAGAPGHAVLTGHRDTHFRFLRDLELGQEIRVQRSDRTWTSYRIEASEVVDSRHARLSREPGRTDMTLVTCYPFDALVPGGPLRYAVFARAD